MGEWVKVVKPPHENGSNYCPRPIPSRSTHGIGSIWKCGCGKVYEISRWESDQREGTYPIWREITNIYNSR